MLNTTRRTDTECLRLIAKAQKAIAKQQGIILSPNETVKFALRQLLARKNG